MTTITIGSGGSSGGIGYNGTLDVLFGGIVTNTTVQAGGIGQIAGSASVTTVESGGAQNILSGGAAFGTVVQSGGTETVAAGGIALSGQVELGGTEVFAAGAILLHEIVQQAGTLIESGFTLDTAMTVSGVSVAETLNIVGALLAGATAARNAVVVAGGVLTIDTYGTDSGTTVQAGGTLILAGGRAEGGDTILAGGSATVLVGTMSGATVAGTLLMEGLDFQTTVSGGGAVETLIAAPNARSPMVGTSDTAESGGLMVVGAGGAANHAYVAPAGILQVESGGNNTHAAVAGGTMTVSSGGATVNDTIFSAGVLSVLSGGITEAGTVESGGILRVAVGATMAQDIVDAGATLAEQGLVIASGQAVTVAGLASSETVSVASSSALLTGVVETVSATLGDGKTLGTLTVAAGGTDLGATVGVGGTVVVSAGGIDSAATVIGGGIVVSGGTAFGLTLSAGGLAVDAGVVSATTIDGGGMTVAAPGFAVSDTVRLNGQEVVSGLAQYDTVSSGGVLVVAARGQSLSGTIGQGGSATVLSGGSATDLTVGSGGSAVVLGSGTIVGTVSIDGGTLDLRLGAQQLAGIVFSGSGGVLKDGETQYHAYQGQIGGFVAGDTIDLANVAYDSNGTTTEPVATSIVVTENGVGHRLDFSQSVAGDTFVLSGDGANGTNVTLSVLCFREGTRIAIPGGEVAVEHLRPGDAVSLARGGTKPVAWLGRRAVDIARHPRPETVRPVRVRADAFGPGLPARDLWLSPDHAVYVDGVLIPVRYLIDGASIARDTAATRATYWHIELAAHDVVLAEGLPCESYLDAGNRDAFDNAGAVTRLHPDFAQRLWDAAACAPLVVAGPRLERVRAALRRQAPLAGGARDMPRRRRVGGAGRRDEVGPGR